jgi:hypothetical protein
VSTLFIDLHWAIRCEQLSASALAVSAASATAAKTKLFIPASRFNYFTNKQCRALP